MGYQLWTSPATGYRRRGTRTSDFRRLFERGLTVASIHEPLRCCRPGDPAQDVRQELDRLDFDVAGIGDSESGRTIGWVQREQLDDGPCAGYFRDIQPYHLVSDSTPLLNLFGVLAGQPWAFVVAGRGVTGIVTRADLQKPPVRALLFGLLSLLEMHMTFWVSQQYPNESWTKTLAAPRLEKARELLEARRARNEEIGLLDCVQLCDKRDLLLAADGLRKNLELGSKNKARSLLRSAEQLRDRVAHSQIDLVSGSSWEELANVVAKVESVLHRSDVLVEEMSAAGKAPQLPVAF